MALGKTKVKLSDMQPLARGTDDPQLFVVNCKNDIKDAKKFISTGNNHINYSSPG